MATREENIDMKSEPEEESLLSGRAFVTKETSAVMGKKHHKRYDWGQLAFHKPSKKEKLQGRRKKTKKKSENLYPTTTLPPEKVDKIRTKDPYKRYHYQSPPPPKEIPKRYRNSLWKIPDEKKITPESSSLSSFKMRQNKSNKDTLDNRNSDESKNSDENNFMSGSKNSIQNSTKNSSLNSKNMPIKKVSFQTKHQVMSYDNLGSITEKKVDLKSSKNVDLSVNNIDLSVNKIDLRSVNKIDLPIQTNISYGESSVEENSIMTAERAERIKNFYENYKTKPHTELLKKEKDWLVTKRLQLTEESLMVPEKTSKKHKESRMTADRADKIKRFYDNYAISGKSDPGKKEWVEMMRSNKSEESLEESLIDYVKKQTANK